MTGYGFGCQEIPVVQRHREDGIVGGQTLMFYMDPSTFQLQNSRWREMSVILDALKNSIAIYLAGAQRLISPEILRPDSPSKKIPVLLLSPYNNHISSLPMP
jgi:hypothetical protein